MPATIVCQNLVFILTYFYSVDFLYEDLKYLGITELKNNSVLGMDHL